MDVESCVEEGDTGAGVVDDLVPGGPWSSGVSGEQKSRERERKRDGRKVVRACRFLEFAVHGSGVTVPDPFKEKDERIDRSGMHDKRVSSVRVQREEEGEDGLEVVQEVGVESPEFFDLDSAHAEVVQDPGKDAGVCSGLSSSSSSSFKVPSWNEVSQHTTCRV